MRLDMADVKPSLPNLIVVTLLAVIGIVMLKFWQAKWPVPGLREIVAAV